MLPIPVHIVTHPAQLPWSFLQPNPNQPLVIGFDCDGVDLSRYGRLCIMQVRFSHPTFSLMFYFRYLFYTTLDLKIAFYNFSESRPCNRHIIRYSGIFLQCKIFFFKIKNNIGNQGWNSIV
jgi:hypothetical protein